LQHGVAGAELGVDSCGRTTCIPTGWLFIAQCAVQQALAVAEVGMHTVSPRTGAKSTVTSKADEMNLRNRM